MEIAIGGDYFVMEWRALGAKQSVDAAILEVCFFRTTPEKLPVRKPPVADVPEHRHCWGLVK
jgi:hypothetical protein